MERILVSGGGGYIGCVLCEQLLNEGYDVYCLDRFFFGKELLVELSQNSNFHIVQGDVRFLKSDVLKSIDAVIDLAGISNDPACDLDPKLTEDINYRGNVSLAQLAKNAGVKRYIYSSSCSIYGAGKDSLLTEESDLAPVSLYAKTKLMAETEIMEMASDDFCVTLLRNATVYGVSPRMRFDLLVNIMTAHAVTRRKIFVLGGGKQWRPNVHVRDVGKAFVTVLKAPIEKVQKEIFNVGSDEQNYQVIQVANMIREVVPYVDIEVVPDDADKRNYNVSFKKIRDVLDYRIERSILEGAVEVKQAIERATVDVDDIKTVTLKYYRYLMDAERILNEVKIDGRVF